MTAPAAAQGCKDFISTYADYADVLEAPRIVHEAVAISILAALLNPHVTIQYGALPSTLDLWTLVLSGSGLGRNTLVNLAYPVLDASGLVRLIRSATWGSGPALYQDLAQNSIGLFIWPEISQVLRTLSQSQFQGAKEWLTDRFDNPRPPDTVRYRATGQRTNTPPITFAEAPRLNILATSSIEWLVPNLAREDTTGGFLPRWFIVRVTEPNRVIPKPNRPDSRLVPALGAHLREVVKLQGVADLSRVEDIYGTWYHVAHDRFARQPNSAMAMPFFNRLRTLVLKLAVIFEVSASRQLCVSPAAMQRAIAQAASFEQTIFELLPTGMTPEGFAQERMEKKIWQTGAPGITQSELTRAFQDAKPRDRMERLSTLVHAGLVRAFRRTAGGRPGTIFVHSDFAAQHEKDCPNDTPG